MHKKAKKPIAIGLVVISIFTMPHSTPEWHIDGELRAHYQNADLLLQAGVHRD